MRDQKLMVDVMKMQMPKMEGISWNELDSHDLVKYSDTIALCHITCASQNCDFFSNQRANEVQ